MLIFCSQLLSRHALRIRNKMFNGRKKKCTMSDEIREKYSSIVEHIESTLGILEKENALKPFTVLGIAAADSLTLTIASGISSFYFALFSLFFAHSAALSTVSEFR